MCIAARFGSAAVCPEELHPPDEVGERIKMVIYGYILWWDI